MGALGLDELVAEIECWHVGGLPAMRTRAGVVALDYEQFEAAHRAGLVVVPFHASLTLDPSARSPEVVVEVPSHRGKNLVWLLSWIVTSRLATPGASARWEVHDRRALSAVSRVLAGHGWVVHKEKGRSAALSGLVPAPHPAPEPDRFEVRLGDRDLEFEADFGVFSHGRIDEGTALLFDVALARPAVDSVADVGTGYGPLAIGLVANGRAGRAVGSEVDALALCLAGRNARSAGIDLQLAFEPDPARLPPTDLTVCNIPTHIALGPTGHLAAGLRARLRYGPVLAVVHAGLEERYSRHLSAPGTRLRRHPGSAHVVLEASLE